MHGTTHPRSILRWTVGLLLLALVAAAASASAYGRGTAPLCPDNVSAVATDDGVRLAWDLHYPKGERDHGSVESEFRIYRAPSALVTEDRVEAPRFDARFEHIGTVDADTAESFLDEDAVHGEAWAYIVTFYDGVESEDCKVVHATAVPFFGAPVLAALAVVGVVGAYAWTRR